MHITGYQSSGEINHFMTLEVLISAVNQNAEELIRAMNLQSKAILINQCEKNAYEECETAGQKVRVYHFAERGVGLSRNNALIRAKEDILLFSDEDIVYDDGYEQTVLEAFARHPEADMLTFNFRVPEERRTYYNKDFKRIRWYNCGRYPTYSFAIRREKLHAAGITYSLLFGGGAKYSAGEDSLFLYDCIKAGLRVYRTTEELGEERARESTWFHGYNEKFFFDRGALYYYLYGKLALPMTLRFILTKKSFMCKEIAPKKAYQLMRQGTKAQK